MAAFSAASTACSADTAAETTATSLPAIARYPPSTVTWVASEAAMLASSWARAGGAVASCRTRLAADARSAARSRAALTRAGRGLAAGPPVAELLAELLAEPLTEPLAEPLAAGPEGD